jgi:hypothetical protein
MNGRKMLVFPALMLLSALCFAQAAEGTHDYRARRVSVGGGIWMTDCPMVDVAWAPLEEIELRGGVSAGPLLSPPGSEAGAATTIAVPLFAHFSASYLPLSSPVTPLAELSCHALLDKAISFEYSLGIGAEADLSEKIGFRLVWEPTYLYYEGSTGAYALNPIGPFFEALVRVRL